MKARVAAGAATVMAGIATGATVAAVAWSVGNGPSAPVSEVLSGWLLSLAFVLFSWVGVVILRSQPGHVIGWICALTGLLAGLEGAARAYLSRGSLPASGAGAAVAVAVSNLTSLPQFALVVLFLPLLFPSGRLPSPRWRPVIVGLVVVTALQTLLTALQPGPVVWDDTVVLRHNPLGTSVGELGPLMETIGQYGSIPLILAALGLLIQRIRTADALERLQIKWAGSALALVVVTVIASAVPPLEQGGEAVLGVAVLLVPLSVGVAITRHGLYEIDRIVSRTVAYALVTAVLAGVYLGSVIVLGSIGRAVTGDPGDLVVALSTLVAAAAFQPLRRRIQQVVDRRFNRARYDAARTAEAFARSLRDELDPEAIVGHLSAAAAAALHPSVVTVSTAPGTGR